MSIKQECHWNTLPVTIGVNRNHSECGSFIDFTEPLCDGGRKKERIALK